MKFGPCGTDYVDEEDGYIKIWEKPDDRGISSVSKMVAVTFLKPSGDFFLGNIVA